MKNILPLFLIGALFIVLGLSTSEETWLRKLSLPLFGVNTEKSSKTNLTEKNVPNPHKESLGEKTSGNVPINQKINREVFITKVYDGDTIETSSGEKIRYIGINAPEIGEPFSKESEDLNKNLVLNKKVGLQLDVQTKDRYGRTLAYVFTKQFGSTVYDTMVNEELVKNGLAVSQTIQPNSLFQDKFVNAQKEAREKCLGMWDSLCEVQKEDFTGSSSNCIKIASINANATGDDNKNKNGEWIEIKNNCSSDISLKGWLIKDSSASNNYLFRDFVLKKDNSVIIYSGCGEDFEENFFWKCPEQKYAVWNNSGDQAFLYNEKQELVSTYAY